jgi:hypothetical protein
MIPRIQPENIEKPRKEIKNINRALVFDSGALISLAMSNLLTELEKLKKIFKGKFLITKDVKREVIDKPLTIKRFSLQAMMIDKLLSQGVLEMPESIGISEEEIGTQTKRFMDIANSMLESRGKDVKLISSGESSCLALSDLLKKKNVDNIIVVDERTTRILAERPDNLKNLMERKLHTSINLKNQNFDKFKNFKFIRSTELMYVAYKKGLFDLKKGDVLDALLWALKSHGCSISGDEINEIKDIK